MSQECKNMELKAYKLLAQLRGNILGKIELEARRKFEFSNDPEEHKKVLENISNPAKWDYCGLLNKEDKKVLETLEYLLDDDMTEIRRYKEWTPMNRFT